MNEEWKEHSTPRQCEGGGRQVSLSIRSLVKREIQEIPDQGQWMAVQDNYRQEKCANIIIKTAD
jgi:hypothetical protein